MDDWLIIWDLFHWALLASLLAGLICPLIGVFLLVRRTGFHGVTLPQFAAAGLLFGYMLLPWWIEHFGLAGMDLVTALNSPHALEVYLFVWAALFTVTGLLILALCSRRGGTETARVAAGFAIASAVTILFAMGAPHGADVVQELLRGEILVVGFHEFEVLAGAFLLVGFGLFLFHRDLLLVSFDRESALVLGKRVRLFEALLLVLTAGTISVGAVIVGPVVLFGLLVLPPLVAHSLARSMRSFYLLSSASGLVGVLGGIWICFELDWPLGPSVVVSCSALLPVGWLVGRLRGPSSQLVV